MRNLFSNKRKLSVDLIREIDNIGEAFGPPPYIKILRGFVMLGISVFLSFLLFGLCSAGLYVMADDIVDYFMQERER